MGSGEETSKLCSREITRLAYLQLHNGDSQKATEYFESAAERAGDEGDVCTMISCYLNAGACLVSRGQLQQGKRLLLSSLKLAKTQGMDQSVSRTGDHSEETVATMLEISADIHYNLAVAAQKMGTARKAASHYKTSAELYLKCECLPHAAESLTGLARCHRKCGESDKEIASLINAQQLYHGLGDSFNEAESCLELARTYLKEGRLEDTKEMLSTAKLLGLRTDDRALQGTAICCLNSRKKLHTAWKCRGWTLGHYRA